MCPAAESTAWKNPFAFPFVTVSWSLSKNFVFERRYMPEQRSYEAVHPRKAVSLMRPR
jgi:hypothetical protein